MTSSELNKSFELIGRILGKLTESGLRRISLDSEEFEIDGDEGNLFCDVVHFLKNEGLISVGGQVLDGSCYDTQLTSRGIAAVEDKRFDNGTSVSAALDSRKGEVSGETYGKAGSFIGGLLGGLTTSLT